MIKDIGGSSRQPEVNISQERNKVENNDNGDKSINIWSAPTVHIQPMSHEVTM